jgi:rSAM/selenodomain-associated transferase 1
VTIVLVLAKAPVAGRAKTRLCPPASPAGAARIAAAALLDTIDMVRAVAAEPEVRVVVALTGHLAAAQRRSEVRAALRGLTVLRQRGSDLGHRIAAAHADTAALAPGGPVLQISTDTPQLTAARLADGIAALAAPEVDAVLGPAADGGWWALGLRRPEAAAAIAGVPMSRPDTGAFTRAALQAAGLRIGLLGELRDVDTAADAHAVAGQVPGSRFAAPVAAELGSDVTAEAR